MSTLETGNFKGTSVEAGAANLWHIHKDHIKYDTINATRVDFNGRTLEKIMAKLADNAPLNAPYLQRADQKSTYDQCLKWIEKYC
ncbi:hypothetical protein [Chryseobacterium sp. OSA05B]|uniref:hypothetical protein n=1 Tax=Chryseobacterium sp. OSA05B TaxID=2862650 RepID=UPI001CBE5179|nr:hypothetical protein [Chryseobacterium sp. OSA05B]